MSDSTQLIPLTENDGVSAVMGRDLHKFLEVGKDYSTWFKDMAEYGFVAGQDFSPISGNTSPAGGRPRIEHIVSLDMAKEISMIQRTDKGKQARQYFIECEKRANQTPAVMSRLELLQLAMESEKERLALEEKNQELTPKAEAYDSFIEATGKYNIGTVAKMFGKGQNWLFRELRNAGVLIGKGAMRNTPYSQYMHHFEVKASHFERSNGEQGTSYTTYVQPSGIQFIQKKLGLAPVIDINREVA